jgi:hypothetical protein
LKPNGQYAVHDQAMERIGHLRVTGLGVVPESQTVLAELSSPTGKIGPRLSLAADTDETFYLVEKLFLDDPSGRGASPWAKSTPVVAVPGRQVPARVLLAGAAAS